MTAPAIAPSPLSSLLLGAAGGALVGARSRRRTPGAVAALAGLALVGMAAHRPFADALRRAGTRRRSAELRLSFVVPHPVGTVFRFCSDFENFPRFIGALRVVTDFGDGRSHWVGWTPTGRTLEWDAVTTKFVTNRVIAWRSVAGAPLRTSGMIRFVPQEGGTCVKVAVDYEVLHGSLADALASFAVPPRARALEMEIRRVAGQLDLLGEA